jgi:hypothetical protein
MTASEIDRLAQSVIDEDDFDVAVAFLQFSGTQKKHAVWFTLKMMEHCRRADQANYISHLLAEFVPEGTPSGMTWALHRYEFKMYRRLKVRRGVDKCLRRYISLSAEGRGLLRSIGRGGLLDV